MPVDPERAKRRLAAIMFPDIVGCTALGRTCSAAVLRWLGAALAIALGTHSAAAAPPDSFVIVALPDTQHYACTFDCGPPENFSAQTAWIVANRTALDIVFVTHLGDIVQNGNDFPSEWQVADDAYALLEDPNTTGLADGVPYGLAVGNHDAGLVPPPTILDPDSTTPVYNQFFGVDRFCTQPPIGGCRSYYGGFFAVDPNDLSDFDNDNSYQLFSAAGMDFIIIHLEWAVGAGPLRQAENAWADSLMKAFPDRRAIVVSHNILGVAGPSEVSFPVIFSPQGQAIYDVAKVNPNLFLMLTAHWPGETRRTDTFMIGGVPRVVHSVLSNYQARPNGGDAWLRIYEFWPAQNRIDVQTYSPSLDLFETDADSEFSLFYDMGGPLPAPLCGDVDVDGSVGLFDSAALSAHLLSPHTDEISQAGQARCNTIGSARLCDILDLVVLRRSLNAPPAPPAIAPVCAAAVSGP